MIRSRIRSLCDGFDLLSCALVYAGFLLFPSFGQRCLLLGIALVLRRTQWLSCGAILLCFLWVTAQPMIREVSLPATSFVQVETIHPAYVIARADAQRVIVYGLEEVSYGDVVYVEGSWEALHANHNFYQFSFDDHMARRGIYFAMDAQDSYIVEDGSSIQSRLYRHAGTLGEEQRALVCSLLFGVSAMDGSYFLRASGLHLSALAHMLSHRLRRKRPAWQADGWTFVFLLGMGMLFGFSDALFRVLCFRLSAILFHREGERIGGGIMLVLLFRAYLVSELTFVLPLVFRLAAYFSCSRMRGLRFSLPLLILIQLCYFHEISWLQTLLFQPLRRLYALLYVLVLVTLLVPGILEPVLSLMAVLEQLFAYTQAIVYHYVPSVLWIIGWSALLIRWLKRPCPSLVLCMIVLLFYGRIEHFLDPFFEVMILDVGQGDCALITLPHHQGTIMIDAAGSLYKSIPEEVILPVLKDAQVERIDVLILTHEDYDHSGGYEELSALVEIDRVVTSKEDVSDPSVVYALLKDHVGSDANDNSIVSWFGHDEIAYLFMGDASTSAEAALLDAYDGLPCDILKLGHHGSDTSSSLRFLHAMKPQLALISVGHDNRYGHPSPSVLASLEQEGIPWLTTAENGAIRIRTTKLLKYVTTARGDFVIIGSR